MSAQQFDWHYNRPTEDDLRAAEQHLAEVRERYKYVLDSPEAQQAIREAEERVAVIRDMLEKEKRRVVALQEAKARIRALNAEIAELRQKRAQARLPVALRKVNGAAQAYWAGVTELALEAGEFAAKVIKRLYPLADALARARQEFAELAQEAGEVKNGRATPALRVLLANVERDFPKPQRPELPPELKEALSFLVAAMDEVGKTTEVFGLSLPAGGPSPATLRKQLEDFEAERQRKLEQLARRDERFEKIRKGRTEVFQRVYREVLEKAKERLRAQGYRPEQVERLAEEQAKEQALLAAERWEAQERARIEEERKRKEEEEIFAEVERLEKELATLKAESAEDRPAKPKGR